MPSLMTRRAQAEDTSFEAERAQFEIYGRMTAAEKLERVRALSRSANRLALVGLRRRHPDENEETLRARLVEMRLGSDLARRLRRARRE